MVKAVPGAGEDRGHRGASGWRGSTVLLAVGWSAERRCSVADSVRRASASPLAACHYEHGGGTMTARARLTECMRLRRVPAAPAGSRPDPGRAPSEPASGTPCRIGTGAHRRPGRRARCCPPDVLPPADHPGGLRFRCRLRGSRHDCLTSATSLTTATELAGSARYWTVFFLRSTV